ncbi:MAG: hypothetical protein IPK19_17500 [Chloroflexi bacterium]|nr:hypothetical protein [Chloroflexota bacterium]
MLKQIFPLPKAFTLLIGLLLLLNGVALAQEPEDPFQQELAKAQEILDRLAEISPEAVPSAFSTEYTANILSDVRDAQNLISNLDIARDASRAYRVTVSPAAQQSDTPSMDWLAILGYIVAAWLIGMMLLLVAGVILGRLVLRNTGAGDMQQVSGPERLMRRFIRPSSSSRRSTITSLPLLTVLVVVATGESSI